MNNRTETLLENLTATQFDEWFSRREQSRNRSEGYDDTRNEPGYIPSPADHSPSQLLKCHRQSQYDAHNAPREKSLPNGIFETGHYFESIVFDFLQSVAPPTYSVENTIHIEYSTDDITFTGSTDPVIFNDINKPSILTEVKSSKGLHYVSNTGPYKRHRAQAHAYILGLQSKYDLEYTPTILYFYLGRNDLDIKIFSEEFDTEFFSSEVLPWAKENTNIRKNLELTSTVDWSRKHICNWCDYAERCGYPEPGPRPKQLKDIVNGDSAFANSTEWVGDKEYWFDDTIGSDVANTFNDNGFKGFLPCKIYPESTIASHLITYDDVQLTPTIAANHPIFYSEAKTDEQRLLSKYGEVPQRDVYDWLCPSCDSRYPFEKTPHWDGDIDDRPNCPKCSELPQLRGPTPDEQSTL